MDDAQVVLNAGHSVFSTALYNVRKSNAIWLHPFVIPAYVAAASALIWVIGLLFSFGPLKKLVARFSTPAEELDESDANATRTGFVSEVKAHIQKLGGNTIFVFKFLRLLSVLALLGLQVASFVQDEERRTGVSTLSKHWGKKHKHPKHAKDGFTKREWIDLILAITYLYASFLALLSVAAAYKRAATAARHLTVVLLSAFAVYTYRDLWPLATFTLSPLDKREGPLLWARIAVLGIASIVIPLTIPRKYIPHDPKDPSPEPNPEQTAPILSLALYTFLDPIVFLANRVPHLSHDQLPPIADYDHAKNLVQRSFKHLDVFSGSPNRHLFFGFMKVFTREYIALTFLISLKVLTGFFGPVGINRLLAYLETHGEGAVVRPWVWISCLLFGPLVGTLAMQWYIFIATGILVRVEGIITQLVFEHALRIRMKAETAKSGTSTVNTPDNRSEASSPDLESEAAAEPGHPVEEGSNGSSDETVRASTPSVHSSTAKGKGKAKEPETKTPEPDAEKKESNLVGKINNLVSTDLSNITDGRDFLFLILYMPFQLALCIWFLYTILGWSAFVGMAVMVILFPVPGYVAKVIQTVQKETMKKTDARVQTVTETMGVLRMIKLFGWEPKIDDKVAEKRDVELKFIKKRQLLNLVNGNLNYIIPVFVMIATFTVYTGVMKETMKPSTVFSSMAVFDILRDQLHSIFYMIPMFIQAKVSLDRVDEFLHKTELLDEFAGPEEEAARAMLTDASRFDEDVIGFENASFTWSTEDASDGAATPSSRKFTLRIDDQLQFKRGAINLIIGPTGSGKTSLLMALLGEMHFVPLGPGSWYNLPRKGGVAYAAQESWVQNETIRDNILFGAPYDEARYEKVVHQCGLKRDFSLFEAGDKTEVGEKGLTLSGGQKARVTLARAIYSSAEIILLDDVLAALDVHTARWIVDKCFKGDLIRGRTLLLVTHNVAMASPIAEYVVSLGLDGTIASRGSVSEAISKDDILQEELQEELQEIQADDKEIDAESPDEKAKQADGKLILAEEVAEGHVSWDSLKLFFKALGGSHVTLFWVLFLGGMILCDAAMSIQTWWMGYWAEQYDLVSDPSEVNIAYYLAIFCLLSGIGITVYTIGNGVYVFGTLRASKTIHRRLVQSVLGTTLRWLDTTPTSRVIARCTQDIRALDGPVANNFAWVVEISATMLIKLGAVVVLTPVFLVPGVLVFALGGWCGQIYMRAQIAVKREMSNARAPVLGHFGAAIAGLTSIRAYGAQVPFRTESYKRIDRYTRAARTFYNLNRWISLRIDILGGVFASALGAWLIYGPQGSTALPSNTGFSLTMAVGFSGMILWWVRILNDFEIQGNSLERILAYIKIEQEPKSTKEGVPPAYWPASGDLRVEKLSARYSEDGPKVLHDVSFHIQSGERVGVLAALDVHTARWIVDKCFKGDLIRGRTLLLVTHNVAMASPIAEYVVSLGLDGTIASRGSVSEAISKDDILQEELQEELQEIQADDKEIDAESPDEKAKQADGKLILAEEVAEGHVSWDSLKLFFKALGGSHVTLFWVLFLGGMILCDAAMSIQTWWMGYWAEQYDLVSDPSEVNIAYYLAIFCLLSGIGITVYTIGNGVYVFGTLRASKTIHRRLVQSVLGTTLRWLDTTPTSRVIARCTQDIRALDGPVANNFAWVVEISATMLIKLGAVVVLTPVFLVPGVLVFALGGWCGQIYMRAQIAVKREMSNARAPVLGHFGAAIAGLTSIRAYGAQVPFRTESYKRIDRYTRAARTFYNLNRWISLRIDILGGVFASALGAWLIYGPQGSTALPSNTGFSLTMAVGFSGMILWWVRILNDFEIQGNSLERILAYIKIEQEPKSTKEGVPPAYWPASGDLRVEKLSARYSEDGPKVLHDVSFHIQSGERVGVVGRTGSGKSSLTLSLLRCIFTDGTVYYDGIPTSSINLEALRSNITIIPQMPELLSGTLRENLDPFDQYDDATLNSSLRAAGLFSLQAEDDDSRVTLDSAISSGGGNLSVGQRQILALARAIVRGSKLLILDEATSAIDYETDTIIQSSLRNELKGDVTLITIAHRLQTIMDADKIMVLDAGRIVEFGRPSELLKIDDGRLRSLVDESGDKEVLYAMAASHEHARDVTLVGQSS
ncbi:hypothetical protein FA95DRAFT_1675194 [Auriscalpium vulgare]|uniref:Uncharacterized protein n=1 Tax=Auriscalpium vulgare TaxID=40419 RepID=A0ACB8S8P7_9AGAM|nr:hypothetical protein FA95DRAFT_1675194 [Auriscalpium vulgare]